MPRRPPPLVTSPLLPPFARASVARRPRRMPALAVALLLAVAAYLLSVRGGCSTARAADPVTACKDACAAALRTCRTAAGAAFATCEKSCSSKPTGEYGPCERDCESARTAALSACEWQVNACTQGCNTKAATERCESAWGASLERCRGRVGCILGANAAWWRCMERNALAGAAGPGCGGPPQPPCQPKPPKEPKPTPKAAEGRA